MTKVWVPTEIRLSKDSNGGVTAARTGAGYSVMQVYHALADEVVVCGRFNSKKETGCLVTGPGVTVSALPTYRGLMELLRTLPKLVLTIAACGAPGDFVVVRLPETLSLAMGLRALIGRLSLVSIVVADVDSVVGESVTGPLSKVMPALISRLTRLLVRRSVGVVYVTSEWLQQKYPPPRGIPMMIRSSVLLPDEAFKTTPREYFSSESFCIFSMGQMTNLAKGFDSLVKVVANLDSKGVNSKLLLAGDGRCAARLRSLAKDYGVEHRICFLGHVADPLVLRDHMDQADVYVSASRSEGLPRSVIEAMARRLLVVATDVGGTRELLCSNWVVPCDDTEALTARLLELSNRQDLLSIAEAHYRRAREIQRQTDPELYKAFLRGISDRK